MHLTRNLDELIQCELVDLDLLHIRSCKKKDTHSVHAVILCCLHLSDSERLPGTLGITTYRW